MNDGSNPGKLRGDASGSAPSIISADVKIVGNISTVGEIQLDGVVEGDVICNSLTMGEHGGITGVVAADSLIIRGKVDGTMRARSIRLEKSAKVKGDVWHETLSVEAGARIEGSFMHDSDPVIAKDAKKDDNKGGDTTKTDANKTEEKSANDDGADVSILGGKGGKFAAGA